MMNADVITRMGRMERRRNAGEVHDAAAHVLDDVVGEIWECGVWKGATSLLFADVAATRRCVLRLFDTFAGHPPQLRAPDESGDTFTDTSLEAVQAYLRQSPAEIAYHPGIIPQTFAGLESSAIAFAYVDLDLEQSTYDALVFIWPRLVPGGVIVLDDLHQPNIWPGVDRAIARFGLPIDQMLTPHIALTRKPKVESPW